MTGWLVKLIGQRRAILEARARELRDRITVLESERAFLMRQLIRSEERCAQLLAAAAEASGKERPLWTPPTPPAS